MWVRAQIYDRLDPIINSVVIKSKNKKSALDTIKVHAQKIMIEDSAKGDRGIRPLANKVNSLAITEATKIEDALLEIGHEAVLNKDGDIIGLTLIESKEDNMRLIPSMHESFEDGSTIDIVDTRDGAVHNFKFIKEDKLSEK